MAGKQVNFEVNVDAADAISDFKKVGKEAERAGKAIKKGMEVKSDSSKIDGFIADLKKATDEAENVGKAMQSIKKFSPQVDDSEIASVVLSLRKAGVEFDAIEAKAKELGDAINQVDATKLKDVDSGSRGAKGGVDQLTDSARGANSAMANMVGNAAQDLGSLGGVAGSAGVAMGQMAEYAADATLAGEGLGSALGSMAKVAGPIAALSIGLGIATKAFGAFQARQKEIAENTRETAEAMGEITGAAKELEGVFEDLGDSGQDFGDILLSSLGPDKLGDALTSAHTLGIELTDLGDLIAGLGSSGTAQGFADFVALVEESTGVSHAAAVEIANLITASGDDFASFQQAAQQNAIISQELTADQIKGLEEVVGLYGDIAKVAEDTDINEVAQEQLDLLDDTVEGLEQIQAARDRLAARGLLDPSAIQIATEVYAANENVVRSIDDVNKALDRQGHATAAAEQNWRVLLKDMEDGEISTIGASIALQNLQTYLHLSDEEMDALIAQKFDEHMLDVAAAEEEAAAEALRVAEAVADLADTIATIDTDDLDNVSSALTEMLDASDATVDFQSVKEELRGAIAELQTVIDEADVEIDWAKVLDTSQDSGLPPEVLGAIANVRDQFQTGIAAAFDIGGASAAQHFVDTFVPAILAANPGMTAEQLYQLIGLENDGSMDVLLKPFVDAEAKADALAILDSLIGVDPNNPILAYMRLAVQSDQIDPQVAEIAARILAAEALEVPAKLEEFTQADIDAAYALLAEQEVTIPTAADPTGAQDDIGEVEDGDYQATIDALADTQEAARQLLDETTRQRQATIYAIAAITSAKLALDSLKASRTAPITAVAHTREAEQDLAHLARRRDAYIYAHTVPVGGGGGGGGGGGAGAGTLAAPLAVPLAAPMAFGTEEEGGGVATLAAVSSVPASGVAVVASAPAVTNNNYVTVQAGIIGNPHEMDRIVSRALRRHVRLNGSRN